MRQFFIVSLSFILIGSAFAESTVEEVPGTPDPTLKDKPIYTLILNVKQKCKAKSERPITCEIAVIHSIHNDKLILVKLNQKKAKIPKNQLDINMFLKDPEKYSDYSSIFSVASVFSGNENVKSISARITKRNGKRVIKLLGKGALNVKIDGYIDIEGYTD